MKKLIVILVLSLSTFLFKCSPTEPSIGSPPNTPTFTTAATANPNYIIFTAISTDCFLYNWDFGNGTTSTKKVDTAYYPFPDTYSVTLTVSNKGGASSTTENLAVSTLDSSIAKNKNYILLTGGIDSVNGKTWVWQYLQGALSEGEYEEGYTDPIDTSWYQWPVDQLNPLALDDEYVFTLKYYKYENNCKGYFEYDWLWANELLGTDLPQWKDSAFAYVPPAPSTWTLTETIDTTVVNDTTVEIDTLLLLNLSNTNYIGRCAGTSTYQVLQLMEDTLWVRYALFDPVENKIDAWYYIRFIAKK